MKLTPIFLRTTHTTNKAKHSQPQRPKLLLLFILLLTGTFLLAAYWARPSLAGSQSKAAGPLGQVWHKLTAAVAATRPKTNPGAALAGTISGTVYRDWNSNGSQDAASAGRVAEPGVAGVTVTAYNALGATSGSTTTGASGAYSLTTTDTGSGPYRVEFTTLPAGAFSGPFGPQSGTTVQFVSATPATNINLGVNNPEDYCQPNPMLTVPCYVSGDPLKNGTAAGADVVIGFPYNAGTGAAYDGVNVPAGGDLPKPTHFASAVQLGAGWGEAYQRSSKKVFVAAVTRRHSGYGPLGLGGIYTITNPTGTPTVANFIDVNTIGINTGTLTNAQRNLPASKEGQSADPLAFDAIGKMGIGDIDLSADEKTLWLINLNDRRLYSIFVNDPPVTPTAANVRAYTIPNPGCNGGDFRPWALKTYRNKVYVGGVCTAETSQNRDDLKATIYEVDPVSGTFTDKLTFPLNFTRGIVWVWPGVTDRRFWQPWTSDFNKLIAPAEDTPNRDFLIYPQPILSDIEFDQDGTIILGFMDRTGMQTGYIQFDLNGNVPPGPGSSGTGTEGYEGISGGDIMRAFNNNGTFVLEVNGIAGSSTGASGNGQGPGGGEFYFQDDFLLNGAQVHQEITLGALALLPNTGQVVTPIFDPFTIRSGGIVWFNNGNGRSDRRYEVFPKPPTELDRPGTFGKAAGLGDLELLCDAATLELGNRIWTDLNGNGIQDANEPGIEGLTVQLFRGGQLVGTATTNATGNYYFNTANVTGGVAPNTAYEIRVDKTQSRLSSTVLTARDADSGANGDVRDSDAAMVSNNAVITLTTGSAGQNDHTYDIGFQPLRVDLSLTKAVSAPPAGGYAAGQRITYTLVVTNAIDCTRIGVYNGPCTTATDVTVQDVLPPALGFLSATPATAYNAITGIWTVGTLAPGASATLQIEASIALGSTGAIRNYAQVQTQTGALDIDSTPGNGNPALPPREDDEAEVTINLSAPRVDLSLTKAVSAPPAGGYLAGQRITYTLVVSNATDCTRTGVFTGPCVTATDVTVQDVLPAGLSFLSATPATAYNATTGIWTVGTLAPGASATLQIEASIVNSGNGSIRNYAQVQTQTGPQDIDSTPGNGNPALPPREDDEAEVTISVQSPRVDLSLTKAVNPPQTPSGYLTGHRIIYTLVVSNATDCTRSGVFTGPCSTATDVTVQDVLPAGLSFLAATPTTAYNATTGIWTVGTLAPGASATLQIEAAISNTSGGTIRNYAQVQTQNGPQDIDSTPGNGNPAFPPREDDEAEVSITVIAPRVDLSLTKTVNPPQTPSGYLTGHRIIYTLVVSNAADCTKSGVFTGPCSTATDVTVQDVLPAGLSFLAATPATAYNAQTGIWTVGTLAPGASATLQIEAAISNNAGTSIRNYAQVQTQSGPQDIDSTPGNGNPALPPREDDEAEVTITVQAPRVDLSLTKAVNPPPVASGYPTGHRLIYTLVVTNAADCTKAGVFTGPCGTATDVTVLDVLPAGLSFLAATPATAYNAQTGIWTVGTLAPGASATLQIEAAISNNSSSMIRNYAQVQTQNGPQDIDSTPGNGNPAFPPREDDEAEVKITINNALLGDFVWLDRNANGCQDAGEPGVPGVTVRLFDGSGTQLNTTVTNSDGRYFFSGLSAGDYYVVFTLPGGFVFSPAKQCNNDATDSDANPATGRTQTITLAAGQSFLDLDAGIYQTASIGDYVFKDANLNGLQDDGPANGINGVKVKLCTPGPDGIPGNGDDVHIASATTSNNSNGAPGYYLFTNVVPGRYYLQFDKGSLPAGGEFIAAGPTGVKDPNDSDPNPASGQTEVFTITNGENDLSWDAGILCRACLSGAVYVDVNDDGVRDAGEAGIGGVTITLTGTDFAGGAVSRSTTTNPDGTYQFCDLLPGTYKVTELQPPDYEDGKDSVGSAGGTLSNDMVSNIVLGNGANAINYNFGERLPFDLSLRKDHVGNFAPGGTATYTLTIRNVGPGPTRGSITLTDNLPGGLTYVSATGTGWTCNGGAGNSNVTCINPGPLASGATSTITLRVRIGAGVSCSVVNVATIFAEGDINSRNNTARDTTIVGQCTMTGTPDPGLPADPGSLLIFPVYTSDASNPARENTQICLTNTDQLKPVTVHLFFVDGSTCAVADNFLCLTPNQTACFTTADLDPGTMGYIVAVAVDDRGCPIKFNRLIGSEYVKFNSGHFGNLIAESFPVVAPEPPGPGDPPLTGGVVPVMHGMPLPDCDPNNPLATLRLDGAQYAKAARVLASSSILSPADGNSSLLVLLRSGGSLVTNASTLGNIFGILYDDAENPVSFGFGSNTCQLKTILSNSFPRTTPRFGTFIPAGRSGWLKLWADRDNVGLLGALFNFNPNGGANNGGRGLHKLTLTNDSYTIPLFPPSC